MKKMKPSGVEWIGDIPQEWDVVKLKYATDFKQIKYSEQYGELDYIGLENIISWNGMYMETSSHYDREQSLICEENDILFGKLRPYLAKVYLNTKRQCCSSEFCVIKILENHTKYFWYQLISHGFIFMVDRSTYGTKMPRANSDFIRSLYVNIPPLPEQQRIAEFLDRKCAEIDSIIAKTKATIEQYKALKQSVITQAVTKGIRPDRPMKDSGVEWIGEIPQEWKLGKIKYGVTKVGSGKTPSGGAESYATEGILFLRSQNVYDTGIVLDSPTYITPEIDEEMKNTRVQPNDVLLNITGGSIGRCCVFPEHLVRANVNQHVSIIRVIASVFLPEYIHYYWLSYLGKMSITLLQTGGNREGMSAEAIKNSLIPMIPIDEQAEIISYLDRKCAEIDRLIAAKEQLLTELESYKKSVIYEYVTGKKEV